METSNIQIVELRTFAQSRSLECGLGFYFEPDFFASAFMPTQAHLNLVFIDKPISEMPSWPLWAWRNW